MHHRISIASQANRADLEYIKAQTAKVGPDARLKLRGAAGETNWMTLTPTQMLAVEEALKPDTQAVAFDPITVSITANTQGEALLLWCVLAQGTQAIMDVANKHLTPEQLAELRTTMERKYGNTYPVWDELDDLLKAEGIITT